MGRWASYLKLQEFEREKKHVCVVFLSPFEPRDSNAAELRRAANQRWCCNQSRTRTRQLSSQIRWWNGGNYRRLPFQITRFNYVKTHQLVRTKLRNKTGRLGQYYILFLQNTSQKSLLKNSLMERRKSPKTQKVGLEGGGKELLSLPTYMPDLCVSLAVMDWRILVCPGEKWLITQGMRHSSSPPAP